MCAKDCNSCSACKNKTNFTDKEFYFTDKITLNNSEKKLVSVTDGVLLYSGFEIGEEPANKTFRVFRDAQTIIDIAPKLINLPITEEHVSLDEEPTNVIGKLVSSDIRDFLNTEKMATVLIENSASLNDDVPLNGANEFSLGYFGNLVPANESDPYDFKQVNIRPHHLARVPAGRCGSTCKFIDRIVTMKKKFSEYKFRDEDGSINLNELMDLIAALPEAVGSLTVEQINELVPMFKEIIESAKKAREEKKIDPEKQSDDASKSAGEQENAGESLSEAEKELKIKDSAQFKDALSKGIAEGMKEYTAVVEKARNFLDAAYPFGTKTTKQIMADAVATRHREKFTDQELTIAFKLLAKPVGYEKFGDAANTASAFQKLKDKEL